MEAIHAEPARLEVYVDAAEHYALLRPRSMLLRLAEERPEVGEQILVRRHSDGVVLCIPVEFGETVMRGIPGHACDDRLRLLVAQWMNSTPPGEVR